MLEKIIFYLCYWWVWSNEIYRQNYWNYVTAQDWFWLHALSDPNKPKEPQYHDRKRA